jgi:hypothetical protein
MTGPGGTRADRVDVTWLDGRLAAGRFAGAQAVMVGVLFTLMLVLRSHTSLDFISFQF